MWVDFCCIEQDDFEELIRGVNSLGLYVCSCDAFITIEHEARPSPAARARARAPCMNKQSCGYTCFCTRSTFELPESMCVFFAVIARRRVVLVVVRELLVEHPGTRP